MTKAFDEISNVMKRCTDLGKAITVMRMADICGKAFNLNKALKELLSVNGITFFTVHEEERTRQQVGDLVLGFSTVSPDCTNTTINMVAEALNNRTSPIAPEAVEFVRAELLRIVHVAEGLARGLEGEKMPTGRAKAPALQS